MFPSNSYSGSDRLAHLTQAREAGERLVWRTDLSPDVLAERVAARLHDRVGSWSNGLEFQFATTSDPWARVLTGRIAATPEGSVITATLGARADLRDVSRFGGLMLLAAMGLLAVCCLTQLDGRALSISLTGVALAGVVAWSVTQALHAWFFSAARGREDLALAVALREVTKLSLSGNPPEK